MMKPSCKAFHILFYMHQALFCLVVESEGGEGWELRAGENMSRLSGIVTPTSTT